jgi:phosphatidylethanolamine/phosphatidyl-N-methylethanolamine N-methyltransferase
MPLGERVSNEDCIGKQQRAYRLWAPVYDQVYSRVLLRAHQKIVALTLEEGDRLLEIGVGTGLLLPQYPEHFRVTGIDISEPMLSRAAEKVLAHRLANIELRVGDAQRLSFKLATFDVVVLPFVITLLPNPEAALDECARVLKPGGSIIIASKISDGAGIQGLLEKAIAPFVEVLGLSARFRSKCLLDWIEKRHDIEVSDWLPVFPLGMFKVIKLRKT